MRLSEGKWLCSREDTINGGSNVGILGSGSKSNLGKVAPSMPRPP